MTTTMLHIMLFFNLKYPLVMTNIAMGNGPFMPIEIDGLPIKNG